MHPQLSAHHPQHSVGFGSDSPIEAVDSQESMMQAIRSSYPGGHVGKVFDQTMSLDRAAEAYAAMGMREAHKVLLRP
ncbi:hypothetical protein [Brevibacterium sp. RIT 803]|uniref:hypothetical protein n=1 Tax=Brevibacterium sp. RIT 803 TaxID=2810210 RepID=UPI00194F7157|nr:hypothetical protein [Brevibacterium sp. RIT 803]MBM6591606.1 hypothetical protein [Brevibacterium sp. RIT 803]